MNPSTAMGDAGLLFVYETRSDFEKFEATNAFLTQHFRRPARRISGDEIGTFEPAFAPGLAGGHYYEHDAHFARRTSCLRSGGYCYKSVASKRSKL